MDFSPPPELTADLERFDDFCQQQMRPNLRQWLRSEAVPRSFFKALGEAGFYGFDWDGRRMQKRAGLRETLLLQDLAKISPGVAVSLLIHSDLGLMSLFQFGSQHLQQKYGPAAVRGETLICIGNTENLAGSDAAAIGTTAEAVADGWVLNGAKAYVTSGLISDLAVITAVTDPEKTRNRRISMFLVDLKAEGVSRKKLDKRVWLPSDLTRLDFSKVFVPADHILGKRGRGLQQVLKVFTYSRVPIAGLALGTAMGAFHNALKHGRKRMAFGQSVLDFQAKAFEAADHYARLEAARLVLVQACTAMDAGREFRLEASLAKYLAVDIAQSISRWAADLFGAASVIQDHPIFNFPMDAWAVSLAEGTQDVQKLVIFREMNKRLGQTKNPDNRS